MFRKHSDLLRRRNNLGLIKFSFFSHIKSTFELFLNIFFNQILDVFGNVNPIVNTMNFNFLPKFWVNFYARRFSHTQKYSITALYNFLKKDLYKVVHNTVLLWMIIWLKNKLP